MAEVTVRTGVINVARAYLLEDSDRLKAWAEQHVRSDLDIGWILGNFVEADNYNSNGHWFPLADLEAGGTSTIAGKPLNMLHHERYIVGAYAAGKMLYPTAGDYAKADADTAEGIERPTVEALAGMWRRFFPEEYSLVQKAHKEGSLFYSMEAHPESLTCPDCTNTYPFMGIVHDSYCGHLNASRISKKRLNKPHFNAGAIIIPPVQPGWSQAQIRELAEKMSADPETVERLYSSFEAQAPHLDATVWEQMMLMVISQAK